MASRNTLSAKVFNFLTEEHEGDGERYSDGKKIHHTEIESVARTWKVHMLPLHQWCPIAGSDRRRPSNQNLTKYKFILQNLCMSIYHQNPSPDVRDSIVYTFIFFR